MTGDQLGEQISLVARKLEKHSRVALANTLAYEVLLRRVLFAEDKEKEMKLAVAELMKSASQWDDTAKLVYRRRRFDRLINQTKKAPKRARRKRHS